MDWGRERTVGNGVREVLGGWSLEGLIGHWDNLGLFFVSGSLHCCSFYLESSSPRPSHRKLIHILQASAQMSRPQKKKTLLWSSYLKWPVSYSLYLHIHFLLSISDLLVYLSHYSRSFMRSGALSNSFAIISPASRHKELLCKYLLNEYGWKRREGWFF